MQENIGDIRIPRMIWTQTLLVLGSLTFCYLNSNYPIGSLPSILDIARIYPNSIVFRIGMLYSLFILFLEFFFIRWWLSAVNDKSFKLNKVYPFHILGLVAVISYGLFVSCVDNAHMSFDLIHASVTMAFLSFCTVINLITWTIWNLKKVHKTFITGRSWAYKKYLTSFNIVLSVIGVTMYAGFIDINYKVILQYSTFLNTVAYFWTFKFDFKGYTMGVEDAKYDEESYKIRGEAMNSPVILNEILRE